MAPPQPRDPTTSAGQDDTMTSAQADDLQRSAMFSVLCFPPTGLAAVCFAQCAASAVKTGNNQDASSYNKSASQFMTISIFLALFNPIILAMLRQSLLAE